MDDIQMVESRLLTCGRSRYVDRKKRLRVPSCHSVDEHLDQVVSTRSQVVETHTRLLGKPTGQDPQALTCLEEETQD